MTTRYNDPATFSDDMTDGFVAAIGNIFTSPSAEPAYRVARADAGAVVAAADRHPRSRCRLTRVLPAGGC